MRNSLVLNRMIIYSNSGKIAYDELFHKGVNIIRKTIVDEDGNERYMYDITDDYKNSLILKPIE